MVLRQKHVLFGLFYSPPNSDRNYLSIIESSIRFAVDTGIRDIILTGDFNCNMLKDSTAKRICDFCVEFSLTQMIKEPTHYTETSSSLIDLLLVSNKNYVILSGEADRFLSKEMRFHCPVYGIFKFSKPKRQSFQRFIWRYDQGDYNLLRQKTASTDWNSLQHPDINTYAKALTEKKSRIIETVYSQ